MPLLSTALNNGNNAGSVLPGSVVAGRDGGGERPGIRGAGVP